LLHLRTLFIILAISLVSLPSEGYFKKIENNECIDNAFLKTISLTKKHDLFTPAIYKNDSFSTANSAGVAIVANQSNLLTELMEIDIHHAQQRVKSNTLDSGRFIENLIYANLRIQRLIDQYNQLHEDADYFQNRYLVPMLDHETAVDDGKLKVDSSPAINKFNKIASEYDVLSRQFASTPKLADHKDVLRPNKLDPVGRTSVAVKEYQRPFQPFTPKRFNGAYTPRVAQNTDASTQQEKTNDDKMAVERERRPIVRTGEMPWMIRFVVSTVDYFINNKIEGLIYLGMIIFVVSVLTGGKK
jgi:hypothetical protein